MRVLSFLPALLVVCCSISVAVAGPVIDHVKARGVVRCGGVERPGLAVPDGRGRCKGLEVDVCRAVASAVLGDPAHRVSCLQGTQRSGRRAQRP